MADVRRWEEHLGCRRSFGRLPVAWTGVQFQAVDPFAGIILSGIVIVIVSVWLIGRYYPGSGLEEVGLRSAREIASNAASYTS